jgi:hypothetical protein
MLGLFWNMVMHLRHVTAYIDERRKQMCKEHEDIVNALEQRDAAPCPERISFPRHLSQNDIAGPGERQELLAVLLIMFLAKIIVGIRRCNPREAIITEARAN